MLDLNRDDPVLRTAKIDAGDVLPGTVADVNTVVVRRRLPGQLSGALLRFGGGEVVEEGRERRTAVHSIALVSVSPLTVDDGLAFKVNYRCFEERRLRMVGILRKERPAQICKLPHPTCFPSFFPVRETKIFDCL